MEKSNASFVKCAHILHIMRVETELILIPLPVQFPISLNKQLEIVPGASSHTFCDINVDLGGIRLKPLPYCADNPSATMAVKAFGPVRIFFFQPHLKHCQKEMVVFFFLANHMNHQVL